MPRFALMTTTAGTIAAAMAATPAAAAIQTFANYSGVGGANMYWDRTGTTYTVATPAAIRPPLMTLVRGTSAQQTKTRSANTQLLTNYNAAVATAAADAAAATAASQESAMATAGGHLFSIATPGSTVLGSVATKYTFLVPYLFKLGALDAAYRFDAVASPGSVAQFAAGFAYQPIMSGTFSFTYTGKANLRVGHTIYRTGANLLSATFAGGTIVGQRGATAGIATASTSVPGETISYSSDFINFAKTVDQDVAISMSSITPTINFAPHQALNSFAATTTGSFSTDPLPALTASVPEPASWAMLVTGFGLVGRAARRRIAVIA